MKRPAILALPSAAVAVLVFAFVLAPLAHSTAARQTRRTASTRIVHVSVDPLLRVVVVHFGRAGRGFVTGYQCSATETGTPPRYMPCSPPERYTRIDPGNYTFRVRAIGPSGPDPTPASRRRKVPIEFSRCWGAASRDQLHPCHNPALAGVVVPTPSEALLEPVAYCHDIRTEGGVQMCTFGVKPKSATEHVALIGDSHGSALGRALKYVAKEKGWTGTSMIHNGCGFSAALRNDLPAAEVSQCETWRIDVTNWLAAHPDVRTVFITGNDAWRYATSPEAGFIGAWRALPSSVRRIYIIRDSPRQLLREPDCVSRGIAHHLRDIGDRCAAPRSQVLRPDAEAAAATHSGMRRVHLINLWPIFCGDRCFPVIGGVLVLSDLEHLTPEFSATLGPYVLRAIDKR
jgi:SGNH domain-containing protein